MEVKQKNMGKLIYFSIPITVAAIAITLATPFYVANEKNKARKIRS